VPKAIKEDKEAPNCEMTLVAASSDRFSSDEKTKWPIFKGQYEIIQNLGSGNTAKVYLARSLKDPSKLIAIKIMKTEYLRRSSKIIKNIE
jgi:serine/threonine protein kinase